MLKLNVLITSTRPGRAGLPIGTWFAEHARKHGRFDVVVTDLKELALPLLDEPGHPRLGQYENAHTKAWSETVRASDAFVMVTPEYNHSAPPALLNALDYLYAEWNYKPAGFVSYGGPAGGARSVQMAKTTLSALKVVPIVESVIIPMFTSHMKDGSFVATDGHAKLADGMLDELHRWAEALRPMRAR